ncbi:hypothetical protein WJX73_003353 [Symbiochloris irregularis]|uniref:ALA-interacting subunit n=1 Tax=Symbiochloris irregularis TaxID=706552 RepID=A0AAW1NP15_9CHLO
MEIDRPAGPAAALPKKTKEPRYISFTQQELPACRLLLTPAWVIGICLVLAIVLLPIGAGCLHAAFSVEEVSASYDQLCAAGTSYAEKEASLLQTQGNGTQCSLQLTVRKAMTAPVFVYYELTSFYQNHRRYAGSEDNSQLRGVARTGSVLGGCSPEQYLAGNTSAVIDPCGLVAWTLFNDSYTLASGGNAIAVQTIGIAYPTQLNSQLSNTVHPQNFNTVPTLRGGGTLPDAPLNTDQRFANWMRIAALSRFRKLWGVIEQDLPAGATVNVSIVNAYNTYSFGGSKAVDLKQITGSYSRLDPSSVLM